MIAQAIPPGGSDAQLARELQLADLAIDMRALGALGAAGSATTLTHEEEMLINYKFSVRAGVLGVLRLRFASAGRRRRWRARARRRRDASSHRLVVAARRAPPLTTHRRRGSSSCAGLLSGDVVPPRCCDSPSRHRNARARTHDTHAHNHTVSRSATARRGGPAAGQVLRVHRRPLHDAQHARWQVRRDWARAARRASDTCCFSHACPVGVGGRSHQRMSWLKPRHALM